MLRKILVPLDRTALSEKALEYAKRIIAPGGEICLLTVVDVTATPENDEIPLMVQAVRGVFNPLAPPHPGQQAQTTDTIEANMINAAQTYLHRIASHLRAESLKVEISVETEVEPAEAIVQTASALHVDTIVLATHGRAGLSRLLQGSVTHKVLDAMPCPVFVIPGKGEAEG